MTDEAKLSTYRGDWRNWLLWMIHGEQWAKQLQDEREKKAGKQ